VSPELVPTANGSHVHRANAVRHRFFRDASFFVGAQPDARDGIVTRPLRKNRI
jgi:hypothetical protein